MDGENTAAAANENTQLHTATNAGADVDASPSPIYELTSTFIDAIHTYYPNLTSLNVSSHEIQRLPRELQELSSLVELDLSYNQLSDIDNVVDVLQLLPKLQRLHLHHN